MGNKQAGWRGNPSALHIMSQRQQSRAAQSFGAGGYGLCKVDNKAVFANMHDPDYQKILAMCCEGKRFLEKIKRFDMPGFVPPAGYVSEMKNYGILPDDLPDEAVIDVYATDRRYWQSLWYRPE
jgi:hypothetical protein